MAESTLSCAAKKGSVAINIHKAAMVSINRILGIEDERPSHNNLVLEFMHATKSYALT
jgi:hypothetical protein